MAPRRQTDAVPVPYELLDWAQSDKASELFATIIAKSGSEDIHYEELRPGKAQLAIVGDTLEVRRAARCLLELHLQYQVEYQLAEQKRIRTQQELADTILEFDDGKRVEFSVDENLLGLVIGKGGANVTRVKEATGVDRIVVDAKSRLVRIKGNDPAAVQQARDMLEYREVTVPLNSFGGAVIGDRASGINEISRKTGCTSIRIEGNRNKNTVLRIVGNKSSVNLAQEMIHTRIEYEEQLALEKHSELEAQKKLAHIDNSFGLGYRTSTFSNGWANRRFDQDDRRDQQRKEPDGSRASQGKTSTAVDSSAETRSSKESRQVEAQQLKQVSSGSGNNGNSNTTAKKKNVNNAAVKDRREDDASQTKKNQAAQLKQVRGAPEKENGKNKASKPAKKNSITTGVMQAEAKHSQKAKQQPQPQKKVQQQPQQQKKVQQQPQQQKKVQQQPQQQKKAQQQPNAQQQSQKQPNAQQQSQKQQNAQQQSQKQPNAQQQSQKQQNARQQPQQQKKAQQPQQQQNAQPQKQSRVQRKKQQQNAKPASNTTHHEISTVKNASTKESPDLQTSKKKNKKKTKKQQSMATEQRNNSTTPQTQDTAKPQKQGAAKKIETKQQQTNQSTQQQPKVLREKGSNQTEKQSSAKVDLVQSKQPLVPQSGNASSNVVVHVTESGQSTKGISQQKQTNDSSNKKKKTKKGSQNQNNENSKADSKQEGQSTLSQTSGKIKQSAGQPVSELQMNSST